MHWQQAQIYTNIWERGLSSFKSSNQSSNALCSHSWWLVFCCRIFLLDFSLIYLSCNDIDPHANLNNSTTLIQKLHRTTTTTIIMVRAQSLKCVLLYGCVVFFLLLFIEWKWHWRWIENIVSVCSVCLLESVIKYAWSTNVCAQTPLLMQFHVRISNIVLLYHCNTEQKKRQCTGQMRNHEEKMWKFGERNKLEQSNTSNNRKTQFPIVISKRMQFVSVFSIKLDGTVNCLSALLYSRAWALKLFRINLFGNQCGIFLPQSLCIFPCCPYFSRRGFVCLFVYHNDLAHSQIIKTVETYKLLIYWMTVVHCRIDRFNKWKRGIGRFWTVQILINSIKLSSWKEFFSEFFLNERA